MKYKKSFMFLFAFLIYSNISLASEWRVLAPRVITNGDIIIKDETSTIWVEFNKRVDYPQLYVDGHRILYSQSANELRIGSDMPIDVYFQYGNNIIIRHASGEINASLKGYSKAWKEAEGYLSSKKPSWYVRKMSK
jgi:hypothetical protein